MRANRYWQPAFRWKFRAVVWPVILGAGMGVTASRGAQQSPSAAGSRPTLSGTADPRDSRDTHDPFAEQNASKMTHLREDERRKRLMADTAKLVALTSELKAEVDNTSRDELSLEVIRKATEIEKLARDVRERMKN